MHPAALAACEDDFRQLVVTIATNSFLPAISDISSSYCGGRCVVASGSRMVIVCSSSSCIDGFHRLCVLKTPSVLIREQTKCRKND